MSPRMNSTSVLNTFFENVTDFFTGFGEAFKVTGARMKTLEEIQEELALHDQNDYKALKSDWDAVGKDMYQITGHFLPKKR